MITKDNLKQLLLTLGFTQDNQLFTKTIFDAVLQVDFANERLIYPEDKGLKIHERQTCNFHHNENFVVFECVHRLLEKGYKPEHIELEPKWQLGRGVSGGRADIMVRNYQNTPFLIIECKTYGREFNQAWKDTQEYGGQVFSYVEQEKSVEFVCLYASNIQETDKILTVQVQQKIIAVKDNADLIANNPDDISFGKATNVKQRFQVWKTIYKSEASEVGIFEPNIATYTIGKNKYTLEHDTSAIIAENMRGKYHEFRTILRTFNVSRRENAFEVLVNLFLCKIVDEQNNQNDLNFYWKGIAYDNYFHLVDRLQRLYQLGMKEYLKQDITYVSEDEIKNAFWAVKKSKNSTQAEILKLFHDLKYYKGLDFDFIKVTNKENFDKNAKILIKIIEMWQNLRLTSHEQNQFLGDMFEYFLDNGIKQSEGQFFTPIPICKFIVSALPLEAMVSQYDRPLNVIDYACGSGHFLTEYADHISQIVPSIKHTDDITPYYQGIVGIEKEDRLAKVAKVATFMHGRHDVKVLDTDALAVNTEIKDNYFDVLIANPPFAVEDFLTTLEEHERERFSLLDMVNNISTNTIQCFFLERTAQLMQAGGVVSVIVPSSILSNTDNIHIRTREILLSYFDFISITELGSQTFGKTGTNTVVLFLRRKSERPEQMDLFKERVDSYFNDFSEANELSADVFDDNGMIRAYCNYQDIDYTSYIDLLKNMLNDTLFEHDLFKNYQDEFYKSSEITKLQAQRTFKAKSEAEQTEDLNKRLLAFIRKAEQDKLLYFILTRYQKNDVLVIKAPSENKSQKAFLGYEWSNAKGNEGLQYQGGDTVNSIITPMFDPKNRLNPNKLSYLIHQNFSGETVAVPDELAEFVSQVSLTDMLDFSRTTLDKAIRTSIQKKVVIESKFPLVKLGDFVETLGGLWTGKKPPFRIAKVIRNTNFTMKGDMNLSDVAEIEVEENLFNKRKLIKGDIIIEKSGGSETQAVGRVVLFEAEGEFAYSNFTARLRLTDPSINPKYLHIYLNDFYQKGYTFALQNGTSGIKNLDLNRYLEIKIPLPPLDIQAQIVAECEKIDNEYETSRMKIEEYRAKIAKIFDDLEVVKNLGGGVNPSKINELCKNKGVIIDPNNFSGQVNYIGLENIQSNTGRLIGDYSHDYTTIKSNKNVFEPNDILLGKLRPNLNKVYLTEFNGICSTDILVLTAIETKILPKILFHALLSQTINEKILLTVSGQQLPRTSWEKIGQIKINIPSIEDQKTILTQIEAYETQILMLEQTLSDTQAQKQAILQKYLN